MSRVTTDRSYADVVRAAMNNTPQPKKSPSELKAEKLRDKLNGEQWVYLEKLQKNKHY